MGKLINFEEAKVRLALKKLEPGAREDTISILSDNNLYKEVEDMLVSSLRAMGEINKRSKSYLEEEF